MNRLSLRARSARPASARRGRLAPWAAGTVLAAAGALAAAPLPAGAAMAGPLPFPFSGAAIAGWGNNDLGQLGTGMASKSLALSPVLTALPPGTRITQVAPGCDQALALTSTGSVLAWAGAQAGGVLGNGTSSGRAVTPVRALIRPGVRVRSIFTGCFHTLAVTSTGTVLAWGDNSDGELGTGSTQLQSSPLPVHVQLPLGTRAVAVGGGCRHSVALTSRGQILDWGAAGLLGNGSTTLSAAPVQVQLPGGSAIGTGGSAAGNFSLALLPQVPPA